MMINTILSIVFSAISDTIDRISQIFTNSSYGIFGTYDPVFFWLFVFFIFLLLTFIFGLGMVVGIIILIPASFLIFHEIPNFRIILMIFLGIAFGLALNRLVRR